MVFKDEASSYIAVGVSVFDSSDSPFLVVMLPRVCEEKNGLLNLLKKRFFAISLYDEMDYPVCSAEAKISSDFSETIEGELEKIPGLVLADEMNLANKLIDSFYYAINPKYGTQKIYEANIYFEKIEIENISTILVVSHGYSSNINYEISGDKEGATQERQIDHFLKNIFGKKVYHSPEVVIENKKRELTDILAVKKNCFYLIESKAANVNGSGFAGNIIRKQSRTFKYAKKAVKQLEGAIKSIRRKETLYNSFGNKIIIPTESILHGIVIVSELFVSKKWNEISKKIYDVYSLTHGMIHAMDLSEFFYVLKITQTSNIGFNEGMIERFNLFYRSGNLNIKSIDSSLVYFDNS
ncbi:MAG: nuclease-related domain-containing protein [Cyanophyceae cyanobacterium]